MTPARKVFPLPVRAALIAYANQWPASAPLGRVNAYDAAHPLASMAVH